MYIGFYNSIGNKYFRDIFEAVYLAKTVFYKVQKFSCLTFNNATRFFKHSMKVTTIKEVIPEKVLKIG